MTNEIELIVVGKVTDDAKKSLLEIFNSIRSRGFRRINLRFFTEGPPLRYLEDMRSLLLSNMVISINLYEHELKELPDMLNQLIKQGKNMILVTDEKSLPPQAVDLLKSLMSNK